MMDGAGRRNALAFSASVGEDLSPPVMASAPALWIEVICLVTLAEPTAWGPECSQLDGVHQTSAAYSILGSATLINSCLAHFGVMPQVGLVRRLICAVHLAPFSTVYACCSVAGG